jgi:hypothetical protein
MVISNRFPMSHAAELLTGKVEGIKNVITVNK